MNDIRPFGPNIWIADGPPVNVLGPLSLPTRMIVVKTGDGSLWINSPVAASAAEMRRVADLGEVRFLVAPTKLHVWRLPAWKAVFPAARLWGPPGARPSQGITFDGLLADEPPAAWARDLDQVVFRGNAFIAEVEFFHPSSGTLIVTDFIQNYPRRPGRPWLNAALRVAAVADGGVPRDIRLTFFRKNVGRRSLAKMLSWDFEKLIVAHGSCVERDAKPLVERAFRWL